MTTPLVFNSPVDGFPGMISVQWMAKVPNAVEILLKIWTACPVLCPRLQWKTALFERVPEENFWTLWCKGRLTEADIRTIRLGATPSGLTSAHLHHPRYFLQDGALPAAQPAASKHWTQMPHHLIRSKSEITSGRTYVRTGRWTDGPDFQY